jgi:hypothetical protein
MQGLIFMQLFVGNGGFGNICAFSWVGWSPDSITASQST